MSVTLCEGGTFATSAFIFKSRASDFVLHILCSTYRFDLCINVKHFITEHRLHNGCFS